MKKILLATTMLAGTAGFAAAEVALSGYAEMGIVDSDVVGQGAQFHTDVDVTFTMSGETDGGLSFGVSVDLDEAGNLADTDTNNGTAVFVSGAFGKLTMGDTDGALDWAVADSDALTTINDDHTGHTYFFNANGFDGSHDGQIARYEYAAGDFGVAISLEQANNNATDPLAGDDNVGIGATYSMDMAGTAVKFGLGYQRGSSDVDASTTTTTVSGTSTIVAAGRANADALGFSVSAELAGGFSASLGYVKYDFDAVAVDGRNTVTSDFAHTGLGLTYTTGALSLHANMGNYNPDVGASDTTYGLAANYDLGGGAVVMVGYGSGSDDPADDETYSVGLGLSF